MDLLQSYLHFRKTSDIRPFLKETTRQIIIPFVRQRYRLLHKLIGCEPIQTQPGGEKLEEYSAELLSFLYLQMVQAGFFTRFSLENQTEDLRSYLAAILYNAIKESRYSQYFNRFASMLDRKSTRLNSSHIPLSRMPSSA